MSAAQFSRSAAALTSPTAGAAAPAAAASPSSLGGAGSSPVSPRKRSTSARSSRSRARSPCAVARRVFIFWHSARRSSRVRSLAVPGVEEAATPAPPAGVPGAPGERKVGASESSRTLMEARSLSSAAAAAALSREAPAFSSCALAALFRRAQGEVTPPERSWSMAGWGRRRRVTRIERTAQRPTVTTAKPGALLEMGSR